MLVTPASRTSSRVSWGSNRSTSRTVAPVRAASPRPALSAYAWKSGSTSRTTSSPVIGGGSQGQQLLEVGQQRAVGEHRRLGPAARARREHQHGQALRGRAVDRPARPAPASIGSVPGTAPAAPDARQPVPVGGPDDDEVGVRPAAERLGGDRLGRRVGDDESGVDVVEPEPDLVGGQRGVQRHDHQAGAQRAEVAADELDAVAEEHRDPVAGHQAAGEQPGRDGVDESIHLGPGQPPGPVEHGRPVGPRTGSGPHERGEVARHGASFPLRA